MRSPSHATPSSSTLSDTSPILEFKDVGLEYRVEGKIRQIIQDVSLSINHSGFISIVGPSGCGKTSLLKIASLLPA